VWLEVLGLWAAAIGIIAVFKGLSFIPFIRENLWGIAGIVFLFLPLEFLQRRGARLADFGLTWRGLGRGVLWALALAALTFPLYVPAYRWWFGRDAFHFALPGTFWQEVVGNFLLVALPEEAFYRGYMQTRLDAVFRGRVRILGAELGWGAVVASALFALGHLVEFRIDRLGTFFPGLAFAWLRARTGSIAAGVVFHALCNLWAQFLRYGYFGVG
jgi:hypothetical protein